MKVTRLPKDPGPAGWNCILPQDAPAVSLEESITTDWIVIGAGFAGLSAARNLSLLRPDDSVAVLDATRLAEGPAGRNSGFMIDLPHDLSSQDYGGALDHDRTQTLGNRAAIRFASDMAEEFGMPEAVFSRSGKVNGAASGKGHRHNLDYASHLEDMGENFELLDAASMRKLTGTCYYESGLFTPGTVMLQPAAYIRGVATGLRQNHVAIFENSPVKELVRVGSDWCAKSAKGRATAPRVILAVNGHANSFGFYKRRLMHVFTYASMTHAMTCDQVRRLGGAPSWGITPADPLGTTVRRIAGSAGDRIVIRNRFTVQPNMEVSAAQLKAIVKSHDVSFDARFPMLKGLEMQYRWGGRLCLSKNNVAAFGEVEEGLFSACCQNGLGTTKGTLAGMLAAELACGVKSELLETFLRQEAPRLLPPDPITSFGAMAFLRFNEWRAGREL